MMKLYDLQDGAQFTTSFSLLQLYFVIAGVTVILCFYTLVDHLLDHKVYGLLPVGTTAEGSLAHIDHSTGAEVYLGSNSQLERE